MTQADATLSSIAIFGRSHELWPVANVLSKSLPDHIELTVVEDIQEPASEAGLTLACANRFHQAIGVSTEDLVGHCNARLGLGTDCRDWHGDGSSFFAAPSGTLPAFHGVALHHLMLRASYTAGGPEKLAYLLNPFRFCARAALEGKFAHPSYDAQSPTAMLGPTAQLDRANYTAFLKERCKSTVGQIVGAQPAGLRKREGHQNIHTVSLDNGQDITADLFVDVSGTLAGLLDDHQQPPACSLSEIIHFDRIISGSAKKPRATDHDHTIARALYGGLLIETPVGENRNSELLFCSSETDEETARRLVHGKAESVPFKAWHFANPWIGNLARLGGASASLGPYFSADMRLLHEQALLLAGHVPTRQQMDAERISFNQQQKPAFEEIRDFTLLPLLLNNRSDPPWTNIAAAQPSESLQVRMNQFKSRGRFVNYDNELVDEQLWIDMMIGFGLIPERYDPLAGSVDMDQFLAILKKLFDDFTRTIDAMTDHATYLKKYTDTALSTVSQ